MLHVVFLEITSMHAFCLANGYCIVMQTSPNHNDEQHLIFYSLMFTSLIVLRNSHPEVGPERGVPHPEELERLRAEQARQQAIREKLRQISPCPMGFTWHLGSIRKMCRICMSLL